jgi:RimJ/RimL family protein N-acetyltransferase
VELTRTPRLLLRHWEEDDAAAYFDLYSREEVMRWLGPQPRRAVATREEAHARLARWRANEEVLDPPYGLWAMVPLEPAGAAPVGTVLLLPLTEDGAASDEVEVGWHLHPDHQGAGLATEAARAVLGLAESAGISGVVALTDLDNAASQAVARRLGMADEGVTDRWFGLTTRQFRRRAAGRSG